MHAILETRHTPTPLADATKQLRWSRRLLGGEKYDCISNVPSLTVRVWSKEALPQDWLAEESGQLPDLRRGEGKFYGNF